MNKSAVSGLLVAVRASALGAQTLDVRVIISHSAVQPVNKARETWKFITPF